MKRVVIELEETIYPNTEYENTSTIREVVRYKNEKTLDTAIEKHINKLNKDGKIINHNYKFVKILKKDIDSCDRFALFGYNEEVLYDNRTMG